MTSPTQNPRPLPTFIARNLPIVRMQNRVFVVSAMIILGLLLLPKAAMLMKIAVAGGLTLVNGLLWLWLLARLECPNCNESLRYLNSTLKDVRYCPYCGCKYL